MKTKPVLWAVLCLALCSMAQAGISNGFSISLDFNTALDADNFIVFRDDTPSTGTLGFAQNASLGIGGSGGVEMVNIGTNNGSNDIAVLYAPGGTAANGAINLPVGQSLVMSLKFRIENAALAATPRFGVASFADAATASANWTATDYNGAKDIIGGGSESADGIATNIQTNDDKQFTIINVQYNPDSLVKLIHDPTFNLTDGNWYQFILEITKTTTVGNFDVTSTLNGLGADGTASAQLGTLSTTSTLR